MKSCGEALRTVGRVIPRLQEKPIVASAPDGANRGADRRLPRSRRAEELDHRWLKPECLHDRTGEGQRDCRHETSIALRELWNWGPASQCPAATEVAAMDVVLLRKAYSKVIGLRDACSIRENEYLSSPSRLRNDSKRRPFRLERLLRLFEEEVLSLPGEKWEGKLADCFVGGSVQVEHRYQGSLAAAMEVDLHLHEKFTFVALTNSQYLKRGRAMFVHNSNPHIGVSVDDLLRSSGGRVLGRNQRIGFGDGLAITRRGVFSVVFKPARRLSS